MQRGPGGHRGKPAALCAGLGSQGRVSVGLALQLQLRVANISPTAALNPRGGTDYPLTPAEMEWQLGLFGTA